MSREPPHQFGLALLCFGLACAVFGGLKHQDDNAKILLVMGGFSLLTSLLMLARWANARQAVDE